MGETWIGVTGLHATDNPHPGAAVIRVLRRADPSWRILALIPDRLVTAAFATELVDAHALVPVLRSDARAEEIEEAGLHAGESAGACRISSRLASSRHLGPSSMILGGGT